jgi:carboxylesterase
VESDPRYYQGSVRLPTARRTRPSRTTPEGDAGDPFDLPGGPDAALLLHGLTGSPFEMRHVAGRLRAGGVRCLGPVMPGHGGDPRALAQLSWRDWVDGAAAELQKLAGARRTFVVGCSMGALVACALAHRQPDRVDGLALLAPALQLGGAARLAGFLARATRLGALLPPVPKAGGSDVRDPEMRRMNPTMRAIPLRAVGELVQLARYVDRILPGVAAPALVVAARHDHTVKLAGARRLARRIGSGPARLLVLPRSYHLVGIDVERDQVADAVAEFLETIPAFHGGEEGEAWPRLT